MLVVNQEKRFFKNPIEKQKDILYSILNSLKNSDKNIDLICKEHNLSKSTFYKFLKKLIPKDEYENVLRGDKRPSKYKFNIEKMVIDSREKFYWLGFICADGSIVKNSLRIELKHKDFKHLEKFIMFLESDYKVFEGNKNSETRTHSCYVTVNSKELVNYLSNYDIVPNKTNIVNMNNIPDEYKIDFIRGYLDGDGHIGVKTSNKGYNMNIPQIHFKLTSGSYTIVEQFKQCLELDNNIINRKTYYEIGCLGNKKALNILKKIYEHSTENTRLDRKYNIYKAHLQEIEGLQLR